MNIRIYYEDTDATGIVYHPNYLKFCDRARSNYFFDSGVNIQEGGGYLIIHSLNCNYLSPAKLGDIIMIESQITKLKRTSLDIKQTIFLRDKAIFVLNLKMLYLKENKPSPFPNSMAGLFKKIILKDTKDKI